MKAFRKIPFSLSSLKRASVIISLLTGILCLFFWRSIFLGESLLDNQLSIEDPIYRELNIQTSPNLFFRPDPTHVLQDRPFVLFNAERITSGYIPLWNPYHEGGTPFFANFLSSSLFPLKGILYLFPPLEVYSYYLIFCLWLAGFFTYIFSCSIGLSPYGAFFASITYMFCGYNITYLQFNILLNLAFSLPLAFTAFQKAFVRKDLSSILLAGLSVCLVLLAGNPSAAFILMVSIFIYFMALALLESRESPQVGKIFIHIRNGVLIGILGLFLSAILLLPFFELLPHTYSYKEDPNNITVYFKRLGSDGIKSMASLFLPHYKIVWFTSPPYRSNSYAYQAYGGVITLVLFAYSLVIMPINWPLLIVLLFSSGFAFGIAPFSALNFMRPFDYVPAEYGLIPLSFSLAVLGGEGLDKILKDFRPFKFYGILLILSFIAFNFFAGLSRQLDWLDSPWQEWKSLQWNLSLLLIIALLCRILKPSLFSLTLILLGCFDLFYNGYWINAPQPKFNYQETTPIKKLQSDESVYRILGMDGVSRLNTGMIHHLQDLQSYMTLILRRHREFMMLGDPQISTRISTATDVYDSAFWDLMNVKYILRRSNKPLPSNEKFRLVYQNPYLFIYENLKAFPRAFIVPDVRIAETKSQALQILKDYQTRLHEVAVIEVGEDKEILEKIKFLDTHSKQEGAYKVDIDSYQPHQVLLRAELKIPGFLVFSDTIYPGWRVQVDGKEEKIYLTNYAIRGVFLDKGVHSIKFSYQPTSFKLGLYLSLFGFFLVASGFAVSLGGFRRVLQQRPLGNHFRNEIH